MLDAQSNCFKLSWTKMYAWASPVKPCPCLQQPLGQQSLQQELPPQQQPQLPQCLLLPQLRTHLPQLQPSLPQLLQSGPQLQLRLKQLSLRPGKVPQNLQCGQFKQAVLLPQLVLLLPPPKTLCPRLWLRNHHLFCLWLAPQSVSPCTTGKARTQGQLPVASWL